MLKYAATCLLRMGGGPNKLQYYTYQQHWNVGAVAMNVLERLVSRVHNNESHLLYAQSYMLVVLQWRTEQGKYI